MEPLRRRTQRGRLPWEHDPNDREANYRRPVPFVERARLGVKGAAAVAGYLWIRSAIADRSDVGAKLLVGIGAIVAVAGAVDLVWTLGDRLQHIFIEKRNHQLIGHSAMMLGGLTMIVVGAVRLT